MSRVNGHVDGERDHVRFMTMGREEKHEDVDHAQKTGWLSSKPSDGVVEAWGGVLVYESRPF